MRRYEVLPGSHGTRIKVNIRGGDVLRIPRLNRGTAFTDQQRDELDLVGLLPSGVTSLEGQVQRSYAQFHNARTALDKFAFLADPLCVNIR